MRHAKLPPFVASLALIAPLVAFGIAACGPSKADLRADSIAAAKATEAHQDSLDAITLVTVDTAIAPSLGVDLASMEKRPSGVYVLDKRVGRGAAADSNRWIEVTYTTWLADGKVVDDTRGKGESRKVLLGHKQVVPAWEDGLKGMKEGGRRMIVAPASLGYGKAGKGSMVPPLATLVFDVQLIKVFP